MQIGDQVRIRGRHYGAFRWMRITASADKCDEHKCPMWKVRRPSARYDETFCESILEKEGGQNGSIAS